MEKGRKATSRVTSRDVAALAGVSQSTVSRVLGSAGQTSFISEKTAARVRAAAQQLGYSPDPIARALRGEMTHLLGLVVREIADPFFASVIEEVIEQARAAGFGMVLGHAHSDAAEGLQVVRALDLRQCDGVFLLGDLRDDPSVIRTLLDEGKPVVALCRGRRLGTLPTVNTDNDRGVGLLVDHLLALGHRHVAFLDGGWIGDIRERLKSFLHRKETLPESQQFTWLHVASNNWQGGYDAMRDLLAMAPRPTAAMASDDAMAIGMLRAAHEAGLRVPEDISITGFDDIGLAAFSTPSLTTIRQPVEAMAACAVRKMLDQLQGVPDVEDQHFTQLAPELIVRESTGPVRPRSTSPGRSRSGHSPGRP